LLKNDCAAGEIIATRLFNCFAASDPDKLVRAGKGGYSVRSSSSASPLLTTAGNGPSENTATAASDVNMPLITSKVDKYAVQACRVRGGCPRSATLKIIVTLVPAEPP
jgi:hypothetical protein